MKREQGKSCRKAGLFFFVLSSPPGKSAKRVFAPDDRGFTTLRETLSKKKMDGRIKSGHEWGAVREGTPVPLPGAIKVNKGFKLPPAVEAS
jgi:hypothetical protein